MRITRIICCLAMLLIAKTSTAQLNIGVGIYGMPASKIKNTNVVLNYHVVMNDASIIVAHSRIHQDRGGRRYLIFENKKLKRSDTNRVRKIYPSETIKIARLDYEDAAKTNRVKFFDGIPADSCWMFMVIEGPINAYSHYSEKIDGTFDDALAGLQTPYGNIMPFSANNLRKLVLGDQKAEKDVDKGNYLNAIIGYNDRHSQKKPRY